MTGGINDMYYWFSPVDLVTVGNRLGISNIDKKQGEGKFAFVTIGGGPESHIGHKAELEALKVGNTCLCIIKPQLLALYLKITQKYGRAHLTANQSIALAQFQPSTFASIQRKSYATNEYEIISVIVWVFKVVVHVTAEFIPDFFYLHEL